MNAINHVNLQFIEQRSQTALKDAKEMIKQFTQSVSQKEKEILAPPESVHHANLEVYNIEKENIGKQIDQLREIIDTKRENISKMALQAITLQERSKECASGSALADSRTAYALSLYAKISNITWDYAAPPGHLAGTIGRDHIQAVEKFDIDTSRLTPFQLSNKLWDMISEGMDLEVA